MNKLDDRKLEKWKNEYPTFFNKVKVLELGSLNINGSAREHFKNCEFIGVDWRSGKDVDMVCFAHETKFKKEQFNVIITFSMLEHDIYWNKSITHNIPYLKKGGLLMLGWTGEKGHEHNPECSVDGKFYPKSLDKVRNLIKQLGLEILEESVEYGGCGEQFKLLAKIGNKD